MRFWLSVIIGIVVVTAGSRLLVVLNPENQQRVVVQADKPETEIPSEAPVANILDAEQDGGRHPQHQKGETTFHLRNDGKQELVLNCCKTSCTCAEATADHEKLAPGETATVTLKWDTQARVGNVAVRASMTTNDPLKRVLDFTVKLVVEEDFVVTPATVNFGRVNKGSPTEATFTVTSSLNDSLKPGNPTPSTPTLTLSFDPLPPEELDKLKAKSGYRGTVRFTGDWPIGDFSETISFDSGIERNPSFSLPVHAQVEGKITVAPKRLALDNLLQDRGDQKTALLTVRDENIGVLKLGTFEPGFLQVTLEQDKDAFTLYRLVVKVPPQAPLGLFKGQVAIVDEKGETKLTIPVSGNIALPPVQ